MKYLHRRLHEDNDTSDDEPNQSLKSFEDLWSRMCNNDLDEKILDKIKAIGPIRYYIKQLQQAQTGAITEEHLDMIEYKEHPRQGAWQHKEVDDETYFCYVNLQRRTLQPGEQAYYCYGNRSNKFLLLNYGFCFPDNTNDSYSVRLKMNINLQEIFIPQIVDYKGAEFTQEIRLKNNQLNSLLMSYWRSVCKKKFFDGQEGVRKVLLTKPVNLFYERYCLIKYEELLQFL